MAKEKHIGSDSSNTAGWIVGVGVPLVAGIIAGLFGGGGVGAGVTFSVAAIQHVIPGLDAIRSYLRDEEERFSPISSAIVGAQRKLARGVDKVLGTTPEKKTLTSDSGMNAPTIPEGTEMQPGNRAAKTRKEQNNGQDGPSSPQR